MVMARTRDRLARGAAKGAGKATLGGRTGRTGRARRVLVPGVPAAGRRYPRYGPLVLGGLLALAAAAVALLLALRGRRGDTGPEDAAPPAPPSASAPAGSESPGGPAGPRVEDRDLVSPEVPPEGARSGRPTDPSSAPPPGEGPGQRTDASGPSPGGDIEERVRARIGEDPRTGGLSSVSVEVDDGMAWVDGVAPSQEAKEALTEVVGGVEGVNIVVNRVVVGGP